MLCLYIYKDKLAEFFWSRKIDKRGTPILEYIYITADFIEQWVVRLLSLIITINLTLVFNEKKKN